MQQREFTLLRTTNGTPTTKSVMAIYHQYLTDLFVALVSLAFTS
jgi:hypothetical protein